MKTTAALTLFILIAFASPGLGGYKQMVDELEAYKPAADHPRSFKVDLTEQQGRYVGFNDRDFLNQVKDVMRQKDTWEKLTNSLDEDYFYTNYDESLFNTLKGISTDQEKIIERIGRPIVLEEIEILSILRNPAILAAKAAVRSKIESFSQVVDLDENLRQYSAFTEAVANKAGPVKMGDSIAMAFPYPGLTSLKGQIVGKDVAIAVETRQIIHRDVITKLRKAYWNLIYIHKSIDITNETVDAFLRLKDVATSLYRSGKTSFQDIIKINIRIALLEEDLITLLGKKRNIEISILNFLNLPANAALGPPVYKKPYKKVPNLEELYEIARTNRQELIQARLRISKLENMVEMGEIMIQSPFSFNFSLYEDEAVLKTGTGAEKLSFPEKSMASMKNNKAVRAWSGFKTAWIGETKQKLAALRQTLIKGERATDGLIRNGWFIMDKSRRELKLYKRKILELSKSALDVSTNGYESGTVSFADAIDSYTYWLRVKLTIAKKEQEFGSAIAELEELSGISF